MSSFTEWTTWGSWTACSLTCDSGFQSRNRACLDHKLNQFDGEICSNGPSSEDRACNEDPCPGAAEFNSSLGQKLMRSVCINVKEWTTWSYWTTCPVSCGTGEETRERHCRDHTSTQVPEASCGSGQGWENKTCNKEPCPGA